MNPGTIIDIAGTSYIALDGGTLMPYTAPAAPEPDYLVVNGVNYIEQPDGTLVPAGAVPVKQTRGRKGAQALKFEPGKTVEQSNPKRKNTRPASSPKATTARTPKTLPDVWTCKSVWAGQEPTGGMLWRARNAGVPAAVIAKADKLGIAQATGAALVKAGAVKSCITV